MNPEEHARQQVVAISQEMTRKGYLSGTGGNVSVRVSGQPVFAITPSNTDYMKMTPADVCVLAVAGKSPAVAGKEPAGAPPNAAKPSIESGMHAAIYQARPDVQVIIHTHQVAASAVALMGKPVPALFDEQARFLGRAIEIVPYGPSGTGWLRSNIVRKLKSGANAYILQNHGALTLGPDGERAMFNVELLEKCTLAFLLAFYTGERVTRIPRPIREIIFARLKKDQARSAAQEKEV